MFYCVISWFIITYKQVFRSTSWVLSYQCHFQFPKTFTPFSDKKKPILPKTWMRRNSQNNKKSNAAHTAFHVTSFRLTDWPILFSAPQASLSRTRTFPNKHLLLQVMKSTIFTTNKQLRGIVLLSLLWTVRSKTAVTVITTTPNTYWYVM